MDNILFIGFENRIDFADAVVKKFEENPDKAYSLIKILRPLFMPKIDKMFNINLALKEQKIIAENTASKESNVLIDDIYINRFESDKEVRIKKINEEYTNIFEIICKKVLESIEKEISLSNIIKSLNEDEYMMFVPNIRTLMNVLIQLSDLKEVDFLRIKAQKDKMVFNPTEEFDIKYCVLSLLDYTKRYDVIKKLKVLISRNEMIFIPEELNSSTSNKNIENSDFTVAKKTGLRCPEILFKVEVI